MPVKNPNATHKVLVNGQTYGFRHEHIPDTEAMIQKLGLANGFDVEIWDKPGSLGSYTATLPILGTFLTQAANQEFCKNAQGTCPENGAALARIRARGQELVDWMKGGQ